MTAWWTQRDAGNRDIFGLDISAREIELARAHIDAAVADVSTTVPFAPTRFAQIIGNCSLEHVREIDAALRNLRAAAADDARLILFVPTPQWAYQGAIQRALLARVPRVAMTVSGALNGFFQHWHLYELPVWKDLLAAAGWEVTWAAGLGSRRSEFLYRLFLPPAFMSFLAKQATGEYPSRLLKRVPDAALRPLARLVAWAVRDPLVPATSRWAYEYVLVASPKAPAR
ncbi:MAG: class I SAM-dependent methyltransferase [Kofleriaceae bacterium]